MSRNPDTTRFEDLIESHSYGESLSPGDFKWMRARIKAGQYNPFRVPESQVRAILTEGKM